jgi:hypothetical protein
LPGTAQAQTLVVMMCMLSFNFAPFEQLFNGIAYIAGAVIIGSGLLQLIKHNDSRFHHEHPLHRPLAHIIAGAALLALPAFLRWCMNTIYVQHNGGGLDSCVPDQGYVGLDGLMENLIQNIKNPIYVMLSVLSILIGVYLVIRGLIKASKYGTDPRAHSVPVIMANLIVGTILYTVGTNLDSMLATLFGDNGVWDNGIVTSTIAADFGEDTGPFQQAVAAALDFVRIIGTIAFIRGWIILKDSVEGQGQKTVSQGMTHILGGVLAINIDRFLAVMDSTFGTGFL